MSEGNGDKPEDRDDAEEGTDEMKDPGETINPKDGEENGEDK
jgi:hypothetical protein